MMHGMGGMRQPDNGSGGDAHGDPFMVFPCGVCGSSFSSIEEEFPLHLESLFRLTTVCSSLGYLVVAQVLDLEVNQQTTTNKTPRLPKHVAATPPGKPRPEDPDPRIEHVECRATMASGTYRWQHWCRRWHNDDGWANGDGAAARNTPPCRFGPSEGHLFFWLIQGCLTL